MIILEKHTKESLTLLVHKKVISLTDNLITLRTSPFYCKALAGGKKWEGAASLLRALVQIRILKLTAFVL